MSSTQPSIVAQKKPLYGVIPKSRRRTLQHDLYPRAMMRSLGSHVSSMVKSAGVTTRSKEMDIVIDNDYTSRVYTCGSALTGHVFINPRRDTRCSQVQINLLGKASIRSEDAYISRLTSQLLLKVDMPVPESAYPPDRLFKAGTTYAIPFRFVIPHQLTDGACNHKVDTDVIRDYHLRLPSTLSEWDKNDMAPRALRIRYYVRARMVYTSTVEGERKPIPILEAEHDIHLLTPSPEDPPLSIDKYDEHYRLSQSKPIRKSFFSTPLGRITAGASQPPAIHLSQDGHEASSSSVEVDLIFDPSAADVLAPDVKLTSLKLIAHTWYCLRQIQNFPNMGANREPFNMSTRVRVESLEYDSWKQYVNFSNLEESETREGLTPISYATSLRAEFGLPMSTHVFQPTFHCCLISPTYALEVNMSTAGCDLSLVLPIQIAMEPEHRPQTLIPEAELPGWRA